MQSVIASLLMLWCLKGAAASTEIEIDASLGCSDRSNILVALFMGSMGGSFACVLPCCMLCLRAQRQWAQNFLDASKTKVCRVDGTILDKKFHVSHGGESTSTSYSVVLKFGAKQPQGQRKLIKASCRVSSELYNKVNPGHQVEVAYMAANERDFALVEDLKERSKATMIRYKLVCGIIGFFAAVGLAITALSWPTTGCFFGFFSSVLLILSGSAAGRFVFFPMTRMFAQSSLYVTSDGLTPNEQIAGVTNTLDGV